MASPPHAEDDHAGGVSDLSLGIALVLPALLLGWPGPWGPLHGVFAATELTASGIAALSAIPAVVICIVRRAEWPQTKAARLAFGGLAVTLLWALVRPLFGANLDPSEGARSITSLALLLTFFVGATCLGSRGRTTFAWCACGATTLLLTPPLWSAAGGLSGALGNSGELSGAALPGALVGMFAALRPETRATQRFAFGVAPALFVLHAALAPSYASVLAFVLVLAAGFWAARRGAPRFQRRALVAGIAITLAATFTLALVRRNAPENSFQETEVQAQTASAVSPDLGGFAVRKMIWQSSVRMSAARPFIGHGPGQFSVHFPPYRDVREIEASSYGREAGVETEVEHPHQDLLVVASELGVVGLLGWLLFLGAAAIGALQSFRRGDLGAAFAAGGLGLILHAMTNATLTANPAAATLGAACLGAGVQRSRGREAAGFRALPVALAALLLWLLPDAWSAVQHGRAIARLSTGQPSAVKQLDVWEDALRALPTSSVALSARARLAEDLNQRPADIERMWQRVLEVRPHRVEALIQLGVGRGRAGDVLEASRYFGHAHELDPAHPVATKNLTRVLFLLGRSDEGLSLLDGLTSYEGRSPSSGWLGALAVDVLARCDLVGAKSLYERAEATDELRDLENGDFAWARSGLLKSEGRTEDADAWAAHAHRLWAAEHLDGGRASDAVRSYRQAVRIARESVPPEGPPALLREFAEALDEAGRGDEARQVLDRIAPQTEDR